WPRDAFEVFALFGAWAAHDEIRGLHSQTARALAEALSDFDGAIVLVSHDRHLIGLVCETFWRVADGVAQPFDGDLDAYA
ncbi:hypothetical protein AB4084_41115, partial [Lysobacter sp. 2RAB21]